MRFLFSDWKLVTRKCRPSLTWGATWGPLNASQCTKYQFPVKELNLWCPEGFEYYGPNLCYAIHNEQKTYEEAEEICQNQSSFLASLKLLKGGNLFPNLEQTVTYWLSNRRDLRNQAVEEWFEDNSTINRRNITLLCASEENEDILPKKCDSNESHSFVCVYQPFLLLKSFILSKPWYKYSHKSASYYVENSEKNWHEANKSCYAFPAKSTLLQGIRNLEEYSVFKVLLRQLDKDSRESSWWMNIIQDGDSLKWLTSPEESPTFVDWERHTDFNMDRSAGVLTVSSLRSHWSLRDLSSKRGSICEMRDLQESHKTAVFIEDRTIVQEDKSGISYEVDLECVPSGWFVWESIIWFKDGASIYTETSLQSLHLVLKAPFRMEIVSELQGYYYCSVALDNRSKHVFSPKMLVKFPGLHTFVLHMKSEVPGYGNCSDVISMELPFIEEFNKYLDVLYSDVSKLFLKDVNCSGFASSMVIVKLEDDTITQPARAFESDGFTMAQRMFPFSKLKEHISRTKLFSDSDLKIVAKNWLNGQDVISTKPGLKSWFCVQINA
ncbi:hypothetical protein AVEN_217043-1 [Araneus ventricosus]|uniref:C-type lectin domain-containing protein n=1 Tax=Araneus ventricosus TaxID=182803 RepID=A0A4Y2QBK3_ARAVE|nr:hypothetical protein AVEN_217043-1 [Araneus ventricosus]